MNKPNEPCPHCGATFGHSALCRWRGSMNLLQPVIAAEATPAPSPNEFTCAFCHGVFEKGRSDEDAVTERESHFGPVSLEECDFVVCEDCWQKIHPARN